MRLPPRMAAWRRCGHRVRFSYTPAFICAGTGYGAAHVRPLPAVRRLRVRAGSSSAGSASRTRSRCAATRPGSPCSARPALLGAAPGGRLGAAAAARCSRRSARRRGSPARHARAAAKAAGLRARDRADEDDPLGAADPRRVRDRAQRGPARRVRVRATPTSASSSRAAACSCSARRPARPATRARPSPSARSRASCARPPRSCATARRRSSCASRPGAEDGIEATLRFLLSGRSAYVSGQVIDGRRGRAPRHGRTGSARWTARSRSSRAPRAASARRSPRCWRATARTSSASTCPPRAPSSPRPPTAVRGTALQLDITAEHAPAALADAPARRATAASTSSSTTPASRATRRSARMSEDQWDSVLAVNLTSQERLTAALLDGDLLRPRRPDRLRLVDERHRRQPRPGQLRDEQGGRDRARRGARARARARAARRSTRSRPASSRRA